MPQEVGCSCSVLLFEVIKVVAELPQVLVLPQRILNIKKRLFPLDILLFFEMVPA